MITSFLLKPPPHIKFQAINGHDLETTSFLDCPKKEVVNSTSKARLFFETWLFEQLQGSLAYFYLNELEKPSS